MAATEKLLEGLAHHQAGRLDAAERTYREVLQIDPSNGDALHLLGMAKHQRGEREAAIEYIRRAISVQPKAVVYWENLSAVYHALGRFQEEIEACQQLLGFNPTNSKAYFSLGCAYQSLGELELAAASFRRVIEINPSAADAYINLGNVFRRQGRLDAAAQAFQNAVQIDPNRAVAHNNLGAVWCEQGKLDDAARSLAKALMIHPAYAEAQSNLGNVLREQERLDEAIRSYQCALGTNPNYAEAHNNLGVVWHQQGKLDEAIASFRKALEINSDYAEAHKNLGMLCLLLGEFEAGWAHYEWRWRTGEEAFQPRHFRQPRWQGESPTGKTILLWAEQGLGDTLQFVRYAAELAQQGCRVVVECQKPLQRMLSRCRGIDQLVARGEDLPPFDMHLPLLSLPYVLRTGANRIPADVPYLAADSELIDRWRSKLQDVTGFRVGINWRGGHQALRAARRRDLKLNLFATLARIPGVRLVSLQNGATSEEMAAAREQFELIDLGDFDTANGPFMDTAAVMKNLDLVITSDTSIAHLAGGLSVPVWVPLPFVPDWRWLLGRENSPWYPTMRLFRQQNPVDWEPVFQHMAETLRELVEQHGA
jgi:tetratricopeptide (TPR) repeat protein